MEAGIYKIEDLAGYVPNLEMSETGIGTNIYIRGIGSGINQGFEQSVGMYVDGVYYGRAQLTRAPFMDLQRVEVLRGPQNILYGKNSIAGAMSLITNKPTDTFEGYVSGTYEPDYDDRIGELVVSGPLTDSIQARLGLRKRLYDGYVQNIDTGNNEPERDEETVRLSVNWDMTDNLSALLKLEHNKFDVTGRQIEIVGDGASQNPAFGGSNWSNFWVNAAPGMVPGLPATSSSMLDIVQNGKRSTNGDSSDNKTDNATLTFNWQVGDYTLTSISAGMKYEYDETCDCDFTSADLFFVDSKEKYTQYSQEFRITSPVGETFDWIAGVYYQSSDLDFNDRFYVTETSPLPLAMNYIFAPGIYSAGGYPTAPGGNDIALQMAGLGAPRSFSQDSDLYSVFGQVTWNINDDLRLTVGGRYSSEKKTASKTLSFTDASGATIPFDDIYVPPLSSPPGYMGMDFFLGTAFNTVRTDLKDSNTEDNFAPLVTLEYDISENTMTYITATQGFKSGGYDARSNAPDSVTVLNPGVTDTEVPAGTFHYDEEKATSFEIGAKNTLLDGAAELNVAYFYTKYDDLQVSIYDGVLGFNVGNAAKAVTQGVEVDGRFMVTERLTLSGNLAWMDFEFKDYPDGQCTQQQRIDAANAATPDLNPTCSYDGKSNQYVADWSGALALDETIIILHITVTGNPSP